MTGGRTCPWGRHVLRPAWPWGRHAGDELSGSIWPGSALVLAYDDGA
jgi:hypothetical protein